jgi:hypothetical protein
MVVRHRLLFLGCKNPIRPRRRSQFRMVTRGCIDEVAIHARFSSSSSSLLGTGTRRIGEREIRPWSCYSSRISTRVRCRGDALSSEANRNSLMGTYRRPRVASSSKSPTSPSVQSRVDRLADSGARPGLWKVESGCRRRKLQVVAMLLYVEKREWSAAARRWEIPRIAPGAASLASSVQQWSVCVTSQAAARASILR